MNVKRVAKVRQVANSCWCPFSFLSSFFALIPRGISPGIYSICSGIIHLALVDL